MSNTEERMSKLWHTSITADTGLPLDVIPPDFALASSLPNPKVSEVNFLSDLIWVNRNFVEIFWGLLRGKNLPHWQNWDVRGKTAFPAF